MVFGSLSAVHPAAGTAMAEDQATASAGEHVVPSATTAPQGEPAPRRFRGFADDTLMYVLGPYYRNPFVTTPDEPAGADIARHAIEFKHIDTWRYGHNLVDVIIRKSSDAEPAAGGGTGALALYSVFRSGISLNRVTDTRTFAFGPLDDVALEGGVNFESKNSAYAPEERTLYFGPSLRFRFGPGFLKVGLHVRKEWNHNGILGVSECYNTNFNIEPIWRFPFSVGRSRLAFEGFADWNTAKGKDSNGRATHPEFLIRPQVKFGVGRVFGTQSRVFEAGVGVQYWHNVFGKSAQAVPGARELTPIFSLTVHLPLGRSEH